MPILKRGKSPLAFSSYRPFALVSCVGKVMENIVLSRLECYPEYNSLYPPSKTGFSWGRSSIGNVIELAKYSTSKSTKAIPAALFLDVKAAFDNVKHYAILLIMSRIGTAVRLHNLMSDYLRDD